MKPYNGFSHNERNSVATIQRKALQNGTLAPASQCCMCGQTQGTFHYHIEDYARPLEDIRHLCIRCHMLLHIRYDYPNLWKQHLLELRQGKKDYPAYTNCLAFFAKLRAAGIKADIAPRPNLPNPQTWYERLLLVPINLKK